MNADYHIEYHHRLSSLDFEKLMAVYRQSNTEKGALQYPKEDPAMQLRLVEDNFYRYLQEDFFHVRGALYCILSTSNCYVSALRLEPYRDGFLLEALETAPEYRRRGLATALQRHVLNNIADTPIYSHVNKRNAASLRTHYTCGFAVLDNYAVYIDGTISRNAYTLVYRSTSGKNSPNP